MQELCHVSPLVGRDVCNRAGYWGREVPVMSQPTRIPLFGPCRIGYGNADLPQNLYPWWKNKNGGSYTKFHPRSLIYLNSMQYSLLSDQCICSEKDSKMSKPLRFQNGLD